MRTFEGSIKSEARNLNAENISESFMTFFLTFLNLLCNRRKQCFGFCYCCKPVCVEFACGYLHFLSFASHKNTFENITEMHFNLMQTNKSVISCVFCYYFDDVFTIFCSDDHNLNFRVRGGEMDCCSFCGTR